MECANASSSKCGDEGDFRRNVEPEVEDKDAISEANGVVSVTFEPVVASEADVAAEDAEIVEMEEETEAPHPLPGSPRDRPRQILRLSEEEVDDVVVLPCLRDRIGIDGGFSQPKLFSADLSQLTREGPPSMNGGSSSSSPPPLLLKLIRPSR